MPQLVWNPVDLLSVLGVLPAVEEDELSHHYTLVRDPLRLELTLWQYDSDVALQLFVTALPEPVLRYTLQGCPGIRLIDDKRGTFLEFAAANTFTGRYDGYSVMPYGLRLWTEPQIKLEPFVYIT